MLNYEKDIKQTISLIKGKYSSGCTNEILIRNYIENDCIVQHLGNLGIIL